MKSPTRKALNKSARPDAARKQTRVQGHKAASKPATPARSNTPPKPAHLSKQDKVIDLLRRPEGATLEVLARETGWQKHSLRGFLAGTVRKKLKLNLGSAKADGVRIYRIGIGKTATPAATTPRKKPAARTK